MQEVLNETHPGAVRIIGDEQRADFLRDVGEEVLSERPTSRFRRDVRVVRVVCQDRYAP